MDSKGIIMLYLSQMLGKPVVDCTGEKIGTVSDLAISTGEVFPRITSLAFQGPGKIPFMISWRKYVDEFDDDGLTLQVEAHDIRFSYLQPDEVLLARDLMNRQIVDTQGLKVVRVNDLKLSVSGSQLRLLGAEVGVRGILRGLAPWIERSVVSVAKVFGKKIDATRHKNFVPKIPFVGRFAYATKKIIPPIFLVVIIVAMLFANNCPYVYGFSYLETTKHSEQQIADDLMDDTFGSTNMVAVVVPAGDYAAEKKLLDELGTYDEVDSTLGLSNVEAMGGYMLTDALTPRQFSELTDLDYEVAELLYAAYAADGGNYGKIIGGLPNYSVPLIDMFTFLYGEMQDGYVSLDADMTQTLEDAYSQITNAKKQLQSDDYSRMLVYLNLPVGGDETYNFLDQIRAVARSYYPDGDVYVVGDSSSEQDFKASFSRDNVVVSVLSILIVLVVLLFTFKSAGIPVLLILVIQGSIWINYGIPTITNSPLFFLSYLVVSSIQMGANIDYAIVTTSRFMEFKDKMPKKDAIIETMNLAFPTIITSGLMMVIAGILIGQMTSNAAIAGIGDSLGRGTIITIFIVMFILPQILLLGEKVIDKTAFDMPSAVSSHQSSGRVRIDGMVRGEIHGQISGVVHAVVEGDVNISLLSGTAEPETPPEEPGTPEVPVTAEEEDAEHE